MTLTMNIIKCGLFSSNIELVQACCRTISKIGTEINTIGGQLAGLAWDWFVTEKQGHGDVNVPEFND